MQRIVFRTVTLSLLIFGTSVCVIGCGSNREPAPATNPVVVVTTGASASPTEVTCPNCGGTGRRDICGQCTGKGCSTCLNTGLMLCGFCNGNGVVRENALKGIEERMERQRLESEEKERARLAAVVAVAEAQAEARQAEAEAAARAAEARAAADMARTAAAEKERERQREERERAERERQQFLDERKAQWSRVYNMIEDGAEADSVAALVKDELDGNDVQFSGASTLSKPRARRTGELEWRSQDGSLSFGVRIHEGKVTRKEKQGF